MTQEIDAEARLFALRLRMTRVVNNYTFLLADSDPVVV